MTSEIIKLSAAQIATELKNKNITSQEATQAHLDQIEKTEPKINAFITISGEEALKEAKAIDDRRAKGEDLHPLAGVPIAVKDIVVTKGIQTTAASKILEGWIPPYDASIVTKIKQAGLPILGKTNLDEFAMGSSTEHSAYGNTRNPWDLERIPGGSGGGSAAAVTAFQAPLAIGTDTGGSIRQPASVTGSVGVKPTYGSVSRYGLIAMASSLDQAGPVSRTVLDSALLHELIGGHDPKDSTSLQEPATGYVAAAQKGAQKDLKGLKVGFVKQLSGEGYQADVSKSFNESIELLKTAGATIIEVDCQSFEYALAAYYLIMPSEASSNLAKFDGMRFGLRVTPQNGPVTAETVMAATRGAGFGDEVKRRIILGTYALSAGYYDAYYGSAQKVRTLIQRDFNAAFEQVDVLVSPTAPTTAFKLGEKLDDPLAMYLNDVATIPANLAGIPGISLPSGLDSQNLPIGFQILAPAKADDRLYYVGAALEALLEEKWQGPLLDKAPQLGGN